MIAIGQWVYGYSEGIFRVERIVERYIDESVDPAARQGRGLGESFPTPLVVLKRCVDVSFSKSLSHEVCDASLCRELGHLAKWRLERVLRKDPDFLAEFENYGISPIESRYGLWLCLPEDAEKLFIPAIDFVRRGRTFLEVRQFMIQHSLWDYHRTPINGTLYLTNYDFEIDDNKRQVYRDAQLLRGG